MSKRKIMTGDYATANCRHSPNRSPTWAEVSLVISKQESISAFPKLSNRIDRLGQ
jgi:hypothetical protein